jgi:hypothetical protein
MFGRWSEASSGRFMLVLSKKTMKRVLRAKKNKCSSADNYERARFGGARNDIAIRSTSEQAI